MVKSLPTNARGMGLSPGREGKILHALRPKKSKT